MKIKATLEKIPGGMMIVPLLLGALLNTLAPNTAKFFGGFTGALITGILPILAVFFFCLGATIDLKASGVVLKKSVTLVGTKVIMAGLVGIVAGRLLPHAGITSGFFTGLSVLAVVASLNDTNGGLFMALMNQYGTKEEASAFSLMALESGPFMTMVTLGVAGLAAFPWQTFLGAILPFVAGFILGNIDHDLRDLFGKAVPSLIPFFAFALGNSLNFTVIVKTGLLGVLVGLFVILYTGTALFIMDRLTGGNGVAGIAASSTAGAAVGVPVAIAAVAPQFKPVAASATALVATSVLVTALIVPLLTSWWSKRVHTADPSKLSANI